MSLFVATGGASQPSRGGDRDADGDGGDVRVFMSYRRSDDPNFTGRFHDKLINVFGDTNVFRDIDSLAAGTRFAAVINERLEGVDAVVALIGPSWTSRLSSPTDFVRMEIAHALAANKPVIPVLIEDTALPDPIALPPDMRTLLEINAVRVRRDPDFHRDAARVIAGIRQNVALAQEREAARRRQEEAERAEREAAEAREQAAKRAAEAAVREETLRRQLESELAEAEAEEAERRRANDALERERIARAAALARLEEEITRRQLAEERARLSALDEERRRSEDDVRAAQQRAQELRAHLARVGEGKPRILPPPPPPPPGTSPAATERAPERRARTSPLAAAPVEIDLRAASGPASHWITTSLRHVAGVVCIAAAATLGIALLFANGEYSGGALNYSGGADLAVFLLTASLLAPLFARSADDAAAITAGVLVGYLFRQALPNLQWFWGGYLGPVKEYPLLVGVIAAMLIAAILLFRHHTGRRVAGSLLVRLAQMVAALVNLAMVSDFVDRWWQANVLDNGVTPAIPRLAIVHVVPAGALVVLALSKRRAAAVASVALAAIYVLSNYSDAVVRDWPGYSTSPTDFLVAALAAALVLGIALARIRFTAIRVTAATAPMQEVVADPSV